MQIRKHLKEVWILWLIGILCMPLFACAQEVEMKETPFVPFNEGFYNPIQVDFMLGDPWLTWHDGYYYYTHSRGRHISVTKSDTISGLMGQGGTEKLIYLGLDNDQTELWAPELHFYQGHWYAFYAADYDNDNRQHRMYVVKSDTDDAMGTWTYAGKLDLPDDQWAIDGTFFENGDGRIFHIWSGWKSEAQGTSLWKQYLYIAELQQGDPTQVISTERVMISKPEYYWEMSVLPQNEGPAVLISPEGTVYCVYAGNFSKSDDYVLGAIRLTGDDPMVAENWEKLPEPILKANLEGHVYGPGHASFTKSPDGTEDWVIYHAAKASNSGWDRNVRAQKVEWVDDTPYIEGPLPLNTLIPLPSGEVVDRILIEAEDGILSAGASVVDITGGKAVHFEKSSENSLLVLNVEQAGQYALYIRHTNGGPEQSALFIRVNGGAIVPVNASRSGDAGDCVMAAVRVSLNAGLNTVMLSAGPDVNIDAVILDRTPFVR